MPKKKDAVLYKAIELLRSGDWNAAHQIVQSRGDALSCRIHALLHRIEGDDGNAAYWYQMAGTRFPSLSVEEELAEIVSELA
jgi:hypothetical protein